jgi:hypothetical protein
VVPHKLDDHRYGVSVITQLIADGAIKPHPLLQRSVSEFVNNNKDSILDKVKKCLEMKARTESEKAEICKKFDETECLDAEAELLEDLPETRLKVVAEDESVEAETQVPDETEVQS